jgi:hypothetical protein
MKNDNEVCFAVISSARLAALTSELEAALDAVILLQLWCNVRNPLTWSRVKLEEARCELEGLLERVRLKVLECEGDL